MGNLIDGVVCTCGLIKDEMQIMACDFCGDGVCDGCADDTACSKCGKVACINCRGDRYTDLCAWCEHTLDKKLDYKNKLQMHKDDVVYIVVDGMEYKVSDENGNIAMLIEASDAVRGQLKNLDIRGLGMLQFKYRNIATRKIAGGKRAKKGLAYFLICEFMAKDIRV
jgi:hypothetical protein